MKELGWKPIINFEDSLKNIIKFYEMNLKKLKYLETVYNDKNFK